MAGSIDLGGLLDRSVVEPQDNVPVIIKFGTCHRDWLIGVLGEDGEGAGGVESKASDATRIDVVLIEYALDGGTDTSPHIIRRLLL